MTNKPRTEYENSSVGYVAEIARLIAELDEAKALLKEIIEFSPMNAIHPVRLTFLARKFGRSPYDIFYGEI